MYVCVVHYLLGELLTDKASFESTQYAIENN